MSACRRRVITTVMRILQRARRESSRSSTRTQGPVGSGALVKTPLLFEVFRRLVGELAEHLGAYQLIPAVRQSNDPDSVELAVFKLDDLGHVNR